jgi:hypothetical protein
MTYKTRKILFIIFSILFLLITPLTILYAAGYKINFKNFSIQKTGALIVETEPRNAIVYLDNLAAKNIILKIGSLKPKILYTPAKIKNLLPGDYDLRLQLEGYWEWRNKITIKPNETTILNDILLLKKDLPLLLSENSFPALFDSPEKKGFAYFDAKNELKIYNTDSDLIEDLAIGTSTSRKALWSASGRRILVDNNIYYNLDNNTKIDLKNSIPSKVNRINWDSSDESLIYYSTDNDFFVIDTDTLSSSLVISSKRIIDFIFKDKELITVEENLGKTTLNIYGRNKEKPIKSIDIPYSKYYTFINPSDKLINLFDNDKKTLFLFDLQSYTPLKDVIDNIKSSFWIDDNTLLFNSDNEIRTYNLKDRSKNLLTRLSEKLNISIWHPSGKYVIYSTDNAIYSFEPLNNEKNNIVELTKFQEVDFLHMDKKGEALYFYGKIGNQKGLYILSLK